MHFVYKLVPPRPTFASDMDETEAALMSKHAAYWRDQLDHGTVIVFGPVMDPAGVWGLGVLETEDDAAPRPRPRRPGDRRTACAPSSSTQSTQSCGRRRAAPPKSAGRRALRHHSSAVAASPAPEPESPRSRRSNSSPSDLEQTQALSSEAYNDDPAGRVPGRPDERGSPSVDDVRLNAGPSSAIPD